MSQKEAGTKMTTAQLFADFRRFWDAQEAFRTHEIKHWHVERQGLLKRIKELEETVVKLATSISASTDNQTQDQPNQESSTSTSTGRAVWEGPETVTTRTFSDTVVSHTTTSIADQTQNVADAKRKKSVGFDPFSNPSATRHTSLSGVDGEMVHPDYAGITIRPSAISEELRRKVEDSVAQKSSSPHEKENTDNSKPQTVIRPKLLDIPTANMRSEELYSADAGHTPLARVTGSEGTTGDMTPMQPKKAQVPIETYEKPNPRLPSERQDSYFANAQIDGPPDEDPALKEPLGVSADNTSSQNTDFLDQVNQSLERQLSKQLDGTELPSPAEKEKGHRRVVSEADDGGPKLRLKQSTNFGAPFGQSEVKRSDH
ncbi:MAG: hypothetical protein GOMPHAMPRED_003082 [Gomphillus americanus]|uniref:Uncharacterized protein n=1 Tax=Gomphillus americanus TaxID=1940652 RepID=A0A8H3EH75_9LECA|nr:MAG: hypothetical protein GOMPHAMPRED_003082 [Gomphillus americanus]